MFRSIISRLTTLLFIFNSLSAIAQISYEKRIEFELKDGYGRERIIEFGEEGFILSSEKDISTNKQTEWKYERYSTELELAQMTTVPIPQKFRRDLSFRDASRVHDLYKDRKGNYMLISVDADDLEINKVKGILPKKIITTQMAVLGNYAFITAFQKTESFLFAINWKTGDKKIIPISISNVKSKKTRIDDVQVLREAGEIFVYVKVEVRKTEFDTYIIRLNDQGEKEEIYNLTKDIEKNLNDISASKLDDTQYIFTGTYSDKSQALSQGLFVCKTDGENIEFIEFHNFLNLDNFLSYLPERRQEKIEKKKNKKASRGKEFEINYQIAVHNIIKVDDEYLFLGEAFYPTYRTETRMVNTTVNGVATTTMQEVTVFDGYQYTHAVLCRFDKKGKILWDQTFELKSAEKPFYIKRYISLAEQKQNSIKLVFASSNKVTSKAFDFDGKVLQESESEEIETGMDGDEAKRTFSNLNFWYDNYFIAYGTQKIKNTEEAKKVKRKRKVYFVNKIKFE